MSLFKTIPAVSVTEAAAAVTAKDTAFIDIRTPEEYAEGHAVGAVNIPLEEVGAAAERLKQFAKVYIICRTGARSGVAVSKLIQAQVNAFNIAGGTVEWIQRGFPMD